MSETSIQTRPNPTPVHAGAAPRPRAERFRYLRKILKALASLRLTVFLFVLSMILIFCGTLAMMEQGLFAVLSHYFRSAIAWIPLQIFVRFGQVFFGLPPNAQISGSFPFPGGWTIGAALLVNLLTAHAVRFRLTWKRSGVLMLHTGLIVLMLGELVTGLFAVESSMMIPVGGSANFVENFERLELAFVWPANANNDNVTVVPDRLLQSGSTIHNDELPVDVQVMRYLPNSTLAKGSPAPEENLATRGFGVQTGVVEHPPGRGVDADKKRDMPSAYVTLKDKKSGAALGTYLLSMWLKPQEIEVDGIPYQIALRQRRGYRPFTFHLEELKHENYHGTDLAKRYASLVRITDPERGEDRQVLIHMNHPLYYRGETFYQSEVKNLGGVEITGLQVVHNPGWPLPYLACTLVCVGLVIHFLIHVLGFLRRIGSPAPQGGARSKVEQFGPWAVVGVAALYLVCMMAPPAEGPMRLDEFGALPLQDAGRIKPYDTLARNSLMIISGKQTFVDENGDRQPAIRWLLDVMTSGELFHRANDKGERFPLAADKHQVFRIDNPEVVTLLGLKRHEGSRYALNEFGGRLDKLEQEADKVSRKDPKQLTPYEKGVHDLAQHLQLYFKLSNWMTALYVVPPEGAEEEWQNFAEAREAAGEHAAVGGVATMVIAYARNDAKAFNTELDSYRRQLDKARAADTQRSKAETFFNHFEPFYQCTLLYVLIFVLGCLSWLGWAGPLSRTAFWLAIVTLVVHTLALLSRMYLMNRWFVFVTNLYSSAVFIGWGCVVLCLVLEKLFHNGLGIVLASFCGAVTMLIAHHLGSDGDTLALLQPVLDTNFWLATHVTCVTLGYTATFVAGFLGVAYLLGGVATPWLTKSASNVLSQMLYGVVCFATLLSFTGTVLGGIWADQSWGRFWGWDPKENGAVMIVIWNALILHARWGGMVKQRGMAMLAVAGNMVTGWSWFGTNQLGVGLHAYGFNNTLATGLVIFWGTQMAAIVLGMLPLSRWASYEALTAVPQVVEPILPPTENKPGGKRRGKRSAKRGEAGYFPGPV